MGQYGNIIDGDAEERNTAELMAREIAPAIVRSVNLTGAEVVRVMDPGDGGMIKAIMDNGIVLTIADITLPPDKERLGDDIVAYMEETHVLEDTRLRFHERMPGLTPPSDGDDVVEGEVVDEG